jgi:glucose-6-phosphate isomerase
MIALDKPPKRGRVNRERTLVRVDPELARRIWERDPSLWPSGEDDPRERLGWLDLPERMPVQIDRLRRFARSIASEGVRTVVLLGMGGSSLAPEVWATTFGAGKGYPSLEVADSTHPDDVRALTGALDLGQTIWLVSSKSGGTVETMSLYRHFRSLRADGDAFVAITDPGTSLERLAGEEGFRETFVNPPDIGGRYSALSFFGLVPAALLGVDLDGLLERARDMARACGPDEPVEDNPGIALGATVAHWALGGRDKLTFLISEPIASLGDWIEQLIAESTGKEGRGITPVVREPHAEPSFYAGDRAFVHVRLADDDAYDEFILRLERGGHRVVTMQMADRLDVGGEMYRWEFATAVAGSLLGVNAFDQPDVEAAKRNAREALESSVPEWPDDDPDALFAGIAAPELAALLIFAPRTDETHAVLEAARSKLLNRHAVATSAGFGPRYMHSTGQLHKGGPARLRALVVLAQPSGDVPIPGTDYGFARLVTAQALGDVRALEGTGRRVARMSWPRFAEWATS